MIRVIDVNGNTLESPSGTTVVDVSQAVANYTAWDETTADVLPVGGQVLEPFPGAVTSGKAAVLRMTPYRAVHVNLRDDGGDELTVFPVTDNSGSLTVDNGGTFAVQDSQVLADNAAFTDGTSKVFTAGYVYDEVAGTALTENDVAAARINANRAVVGAIEDGTTRGRYATVTASNALKVDASVAAVPAKAQDGDGNNLTSAARGSERALSVQIVDASGNQVTTFGGSSLGTTSSLSNVSASASSVTVLASNASRKFAVIFNDSSALVYIKFGTTASSTSFTYRLGAYETLEVTAYSGRIDGIWASATGTARVTEIT